MNWCVFYLILLTEHASQCFLAQADSVACGRKMRHLTKICVALGLLIAGALATAVEAAPNSPKPKRDGRICRTAYLNCLNSCFKIKDARRETACLARCSINQHRCEANLGIPRTQSGVGRPEVRPVRGGQTRTLPEFDRGHRFPSPERQTIRPERPPNRSPVGRR